MVYLCNIATIIWCTSVTLLLLDDVPMLQVLALKKEGVDGNYQGRVSALKESYSHLINRLRCLYTNNLIGKCPSIMKLFSPDSDL